MVDWSNLSIDVLGEITKHLTLLVDLDAFGSVCPLWRYVATMEKPKFLFKLTPWLMLAPEEPIDERSFYSVSEDSIRYFFLPEVNSRRCLSSKGWLLTVVEVDLSMALLHPFSRFEIELPHAKTLEYLDHFYRGGLDPTQFHVQLISKFFLSSNPMCTSDYLIIVLYGYVGDVAYCRHGDKSWTKFESPIIKYPNYDITYYEGLYYVINWFGQIIQCDLTTNVLVEVAQMPHKKSSTSTLYMIESVGALIVVERIIYFEECEEEVTYGTTGFKVFQVELKNNKWSEMNDLGGRTLFVGYNSSFSLESCYCKFNCIYFTDDCLEEYLYKGGKGEKDIGIYNILDGSIEPYFYFQGSSYSRVNPPMWVQQN